MVGNNPSVKHAMTPVQEVVNAITMILPTAVLAVNAWNSQNKLVMILLMGSSMHLPVSFTYHLSVAFNRYSDRLDNDMRRLDQSLQHVVGVMYSFALSGSFEYFLLNLIFNARAVIHLWDSKKSNDGKRWIPIMFCVLMYTFPMLWRGDFCNYGLAMVSMIIGGVSFVPQLNTRVCRGWGHTVLHTILMVYAQALSRHILSKNFQYPCINRYHPISRLLISTD
eukprot:768817-Hanusia_phi.AAC.12